MTPWFLANAFLICGMQKWLSINFRLPYNIQAAKVHMYQGHYSLFLPIAPFRWHSCPHIVLTDASVAFSVMDVLWQVQCEMDC